MTCPRCRSTRSHVIECADGYSRVCSDCGLPAKGDPERIHDLLAPKPERKFMRYKCHSCGGEVRDAPVCSGCFRHVAKWLRMVPELAWELHLTITKQTRYDESQHVSGTATPPLPLQPEASDTRDHLRAVLASWVKFIEEETAA